MKKRRKNPHAVAFGRLGGLVRSEAKKRCFGRPEEIENVSGYYALNAIVRSDLPIEKERAGMEPSPRR
jgi:hypothetical protein